MNKGHKTGTQRARVLAVLSEGPSTAPEMAAETGLGLKHCSAYLTTLVAEGIAEKTGKMPRQRCEHCGHKPSGATANIYGLIVKAAS